MSGVEKALIIGGLSGIGEEVGRVLREERGWDTARPSSVTMDVRHHVIVREFMETFGPFDNVVYSAGVNELCWIKDMTEHTLHQHMAVNLYGFLMLAGTQQTVFPGHPMNMVVIGSDAARIPMRGSTAYNASKAAAVFAVKNMARELAGEGWRINMVSPAMVSDTPMTDYIDNTVPEFRGWSGEYARDYEMMGSPMRRRITKLEVAHVVCDLLMGPETVNGANWEITGGR
jgi:NAD(P)-dependent dehydrogenase (short-subunit alcohol dehydrogenase family)